MKAAELALSFGAVCYAVQANVFLIFGSDCFYLFIYLLTQKIAGLQVTSRRPCWWSKTKEFLSAGK